MVVSSTRPTRSMSSTWELAWWNLGRPRRLICPANRQANQAGFFGNGDIWSVGGIDGATFQFLNEVRHRTNGGGGCASPTPTPYRDGYSYCNSYCNSYRYSYSDRYRYSDAQLRRPDLRLRRGLNRRRDQLPHRGLARHRSRAPGRLPHQRPEIS